MFLKTRLNTNKKKRKKNTKLDKINCDRYIITEILRKYFKFILKTKITLTYI